ncbi:hypothetical protein AGDE_04287 [Angomonas deanei]|uniref:Helicase associated domain (HA2)/Oligonucleotide/oligosaccharide-binding (OB)-fold, putative n=1 Tax=Angomonas deanei TaxID=59799 RepID=A0A7G2C4V2_9TRYP|nr:hypothetical protein AGDE_04287 [Angomonas deanei]CAD2214174.1 Helicase associated domain (HA2)/Oligonucleotide/oligosaccharide-binding (OB)-fold, putative [Angomonas deanei]|eukprot:EPY39641.1 hypothetical protein AGDE_04287 [Angomonas deanei]
MSAVVLQLKALGIDNLLQFEFLDPPSTDALERALDHLFLLGAMNAKGELTVTGRRMAEFPLDPSLSKCLIKGCALKCGRHMAMAAAMLSLDSVFINTRDPKERQLLDSAKTQLFAFGNGDVTGYIRLMEDWLRSGSQSANFCKANCVHPRALIRARDVMDQIMRTFDRIGLDVGQEEGLINVESITKALLSGFFFNVSKLELDNRTYSIIRPLSGGEATVDLESRLAELHPTSFLFKAGSFKKNENKEYDPSLPPVLKERPSFIVFTQLRRTTKRYMIHVSAILEKDWILKSAPENYFTEAELETGLRKRPRS